MQESLYADQYQKESDYWWHRGKRLMLHNAIQMQVARCEGRAVVVDLGCGTGAFVEEVNRYACGIGVDALPEALRFSRKRGLARLCAADLDNSHLPFSDQSMDVVVLADCLEHVRNDAALLREAVRVLADDGIMVIVVPAYQWLWSYWDVIVGHQRRYTWSTLRRAITEAGLEVQQHTYILMFLLPIATFWRAIRHVWFRQDLKQGESEFILLPGFLNAFFFWLYRLEIYLAEWIDLPFGLSLMAVCSKQAGRLSFPP
jgi:SAM-dependent methyltransferase